MRVDKLHLQNFGQFHDKDITLSPGINVLYGANEAGKTTIKDFIVDMLYGIDKETDSGIRFDHYAQKKPIGGSEFSGAMEVSVNGEKYYVQRNFIQQEQNTMVKDLDTGMEISLVKENSLLDTLIHTDKSTYVNTLCIGESGAATDKGITDKLNNYIVNMTSTGSGDVDAAGAVNQLREKKRSYSNKELELKEQELTEKIDIDRDFDGEIAEVREEIAKVQQEMKEPKEEKQLQFTPIKNSSAQEETEEKVQEPEEEKEPLTKLERDKKMLQNMGPKSILDNSVIIVFLALVAMAIFVGIAYVIPANVPQVKLGVMLFGVLLVFSTAVQVLYRKNQLYKLLEEMEIAQSFEEAKAESVDVEVQRDYANQISKLQLREQEIMKQRSEQEEILSELTRIKEQMHANEIECAALDLAIKTIQDLSEEIYDSFGNILNDQVSNIISRITGGKYSEVRIDDQLRVMVKSGNSYITMEYLSAGTMEQIYLALRLSIAGLLVQEDLPILMDDAFIAYDYQRLKDTLHCLGDYLNRQIIICTANPGIQDIFTGLGMESNYIVI